MSFKSPPEIARTGVETGVTKAALSWDKALFAVMPPGDINGST